MQVKQFKAYTNTRSIIITSLIDYVYTNKLFTVCGTFEILDLNIFDFYNG